MGVFPGETLDARKVGETGVARKTGVPRTKEISVCVILD